MRKPQVILLGAWLLVGMMSAGAQDVSKEKQKLLAKRAAEADAYRKLAEAVYGLQIDSRTYVKDFVAESDEIRTDVDSFVKGIRLGRPTWYDDGSCEIPAEVTVAKVVETLRSAHDRHYTGHSIKTSDIESITRRTEKKVIKAIGMGAPREDLPPELPIGALEILGPPPSDLPTPPIPDIWRQAGARARLMAIRAARVDAIRKLAERIKGLRLTSRTQVRDFVVESDEITTELNTNLASAGEEVGHPYLHHDELIAEVTLRLSTEQVITTVKKLHSRYYEGDDIQGHDIEDIVKTVVKKDFEGTGTGVPPEKYLQSYAQKAQVTLPEWSLGRITAVGMGTDPAFDTPQGRLKAARAAEVDAKRKLVEQIYGMRIMAETSVRDFVAEYDHVETLVDAFVVDAVVVGTDFGADTATVTVAIPGLRVWEVINQEIRRQERQ
ncbi:MAG: LPP20 family lipoprotein [Phycisphaerae bacterium]|nr:LPP20 family lipoprotein [Phycisphaerae bacterium]